MFRHLFVIGDSIYRLRVHQHAKRFSKSLQDRNVKVEYNIQEDGGTPVMYLCDYNSDAVWHGIYHHNVFKEIIELIDSLDTRRLDRAISRAAKVPPR